MSIVQIIVGFLSIVIIYLGMTSKRSIEKNSVDIVCEILEINKKEQSLTVSVIDENNIEIEKAKVFCPGTNILYFATDHSTGDKSKIEFGDLYVGNTIFINAINSKRFKVAKQVEVMSIGHIRLPVRTE